MIRVRVALNGLPGGRELATHYFGGTGGGGDAQLAVDHVRDFWAAIDDQLSNSLSWATEAEVPQIDPVTGDLLGFNVTTVRTGVGALTGEVLPALVQGLVVWQTGTIAAGRRVLGHTFIPANTESNNPAGANPAPGPSLTTAVNAGITAMFAGTSPGIGVWSRTHGVFAPATSGALRPFWSVLRSRRG